MPPQMLVREAPAAARRRVFDATLVPGWRQVLPGIAAFVTVASLAAKEGGYFPREWSWGALWLLWIAAIALLVGSPGMLGRLEWVFFGGLAALTLWSGLSASWSDSSAGSLDEVERNLVYVAGVLAILLLMRRRAVKPLLVGVLCATSVICAYALATRLFPERLGTYNPIAVYRLSAPIGYWNALGIFAVMGALLALGFAARARQPLARALAAGSLVIFIPTTYFTFGRGPWLALAIGLVAAIALDPRRLQLVTTLLVAGIAPALAVWIASRSDALNRQQAPLAQASHDGHRLTLVLVALAVGAAAAMFVFATVEQRVNISSRLRLTYAAVLLVLVIGALIAVSARYGSPPTIASKAYKAFKAPPVNVSHSRLTKRLFSFSGNGRADLWGAAWKDYRAHPLLGSGAGSYEKYWMQHRPTGLVVRNAHNVYVETLATLGPIGLLLLIGVFLTPLIAAVKARRHALVPAALGAYVAYLAHTGADWDWQLTAVTLAALLCGIALLVASRDRSMPPVSKRFRVAAFAGIGVVAVFVVVGLIGNWAMRISVDSAQAQDWKKTESWARRAMFWEPWSPDPWRWVGQAQLARNELADARASFRKAITKDRGDWVLWYQLARASKGAAARAALAEATRLNPKGPEIVQLRAELRAKGRLSGP